MWFQEARQFIMKHHIHALFILFTILFFALAAIPVAAAFPTEAFDLPAGGLWFPFDGNAEEASGALTGKLRGSPPFVEGRDGTPDGAISFETEQQAVGLYLDDIEGNWTASFWVRPTAITKHSFLCSSMTGSLRVIQDNGLVGATMNGILDRSVPYQIPLDTWTMLTFAYDDDMECTYVYIDGVFFDGMYGYQTLGLTLIGNDAPEQKGWQSAPAYALDDAWFFGRLLTDEEIRTLYETNVPPPPPEESEELTPAAEIAPAEEIEAAAELEAAEEIEPQDAGDEEPEDADDAPEENIPREPKPGGFAVMAVIALAALFLIIAGGRALFGRRTK